jgi:rubredoxin
LESGGSVAHGAGRRRRSCGGGAPEDGIAPGTRWADVPPNWTCPECGARKEDFEMAEF